MPPEGSDLTFDHRHNAADRVILDCQARHLVQSCMPCGVPHPEGEADRRWRCRMWAARTPPGRYGRRRRLGSVCQTGDGHQPETADRQAAMPGNATADLTSAAQTIKGAGRIRLPGASTSIPASR